MKSATLKVKIPNFRAYPDRLLGLMIQQKDPNKGLFRAPQGRTSHSGIPKFTAGAAFKAC